MVRTSFKRRLGAMGMRLHRWSEGSWSTSHSKSGKLFYRRLRPVRFADMDAFAGFCRSFEGFRGATSVSVTWSNSNAVVGPPFGDVASRIAHAASYDRSYIEVRGQMATDQGRDMWTVYFNSRVGEAGTTFVIDEDSDYLVNLPDHIQQTIERFCVPMTRRELRKGRPLLDPISLDDAVQRAHDREISDRAARTGLYGALAGAVLGAVFGAIFGAMASSPDSSDAPAPTPTSTTSRAAPHDQWAAAGLL